MQILLFYFGSSIIFLWGVGHLFPTGNVVSGFGDLSLDNKRIITMEWIAEGLTLCFLGGLVAMMVFAVGADHTATHFVARASSMMLFILAGVSIFTGARTAVVPMRLCPYIKSAVGIIYIIASYIRTY